MNEKLPRPTVEDEVTVQAVRLLSSLVLVRTAPEAVAPTAVKSSQAVTAAPAAVVAAAETATYPPAG